MATPMDIGTLIVSTPGYCGGRPRIADTRMPVHTIAAYWKSGYSAEDIVTRAFRTLDLGQVHAALAYYFVNREMFDRMLAEDSAAHNEAAAQQLRDGGGPAWLSDAERAARIEELDGEARLLRSRLG